MVNISDTKISEFVELASPEGADYVPIVDSSLVVSNPATANKRALVSNLNPVTISPTAPSSIFVGKLWLDTDDTLTPGTQGVTGVQGNTGIRGLTGTQGATGIQGTTGVTGDQGVTGPQGITGSQGITGIQGQTGIQGVTGSQGVQGVTGIVGSTGDQGATGITGTTGAQGITGSQGVQGITGVVGSTGIQGATGVVGTTGAIGTTGAQGIQGQTGVIGTTGVQGYTGLQGNTGIQGVTGLQGVTGTQGITGIQGITGLQGITGAIGATGAVPTVMAITDDTTTNATMYPVWVTTASGNQAAKVSSTKLVFNPSTGNFGIGTTGPTANLNVVSATNSNTFRVENTFGASYTENQIYVNNYRASNSAFNLLRMDVNNGATTQFTVRGDGQVYMSGNVGIGTTNPTNGVLEVTGQVYFSANCSALSFTDRTPFYEGDALAELKGIKGKNGKIDHNTLPHFARAKHTVPDSKGKPLVQEERDLGAMISILTVASQQLDARLSKLEGVK